MVMPWDVCDRVGYPGRQGSIDLANCPIGAPNDETSVFVVATVVEHVDPMNERDDHAQVRDGPRVAGDDLVDGNGMSVARWMNSILSGADKTVSKAIP